MRTHFATWEANKTFERFDDRARRVLVLAQEEAGRLHHGTIGTRHLLVGLMHEEEGLAAEALVSLGISLEAVRDKVQEAVEPPGSSRPGSPPIDWQPNSSPPFAPRAKKVLELSLREALQLGHNYVGTEHMLLGIVREGEGVAVQVLIDLGADPVHVRQRVLQLLSVSAEREVRPAPPGEPVGVTGHLTRPRTEPAESPKMPVGESWAAQVVRAGRGPMDFGEAYQRLANLVQGLGIDLDDGRITVTSVETNAGPGLRLLATHEVDDDSNPPPGERGGAGSGPAGAGRRP